MTRLFHRRLIGSAARLALGAAGLWAAAFADHAAEAPAHPPLYALLVGGGPDEASNAAQIEGHVRFVGEILPAAAKRVVLFADGKTDRASVSYLDADKIPEPTRALAVLLPDASPAPQVRPPALGLKIEGPSRVQELHRAVTRLAAEVSAAPAPLLLFFAGHGTQNEDREEETGYDMWDGDELSVRAFSADLARLPAAAPVVLVMAQCYSGAFGNLLFRKADPEGALAPRDFAAFFSARKDRMASGCSTQTTAADYQDFSSYFFAALCGHNRFGQVVERADFDRDGKVSLHEAFCYALIHDASIDTPVCTSDVFLRRFAALPEAEIYARPYREILQAATPAQRAVLDALSAQLGLTGEDRPLAVFDRLRFSDPIARGDLVQADNEALARLNTLRQSTLKSFFQWWPDLRWSVPADRPPAIVAATRELAGDKSLAHSLLDADQTYQAAEDAIDNDEAQLLRFAGVCESVVEAHRLREGNREELKRSFERIWTAEQRSLPVSGR